MPLEIPPALLLALLLALPVALAVRLGQVALRDWREVRARARRQARAEQAEEEAWALLEDHGYRVLEEQVEGGWTLQVDEEWLEVDLRADYLVVDRRGARFVAEVKSGRVAPRIEHGATRRQLLEYRVAFAPDIAGVLLVDMARRQIRQVRFGALEDALGQPRRGGLGRLMRAMWWATLGAMAGAGAAAAGLLPPWW